MTTITIQEAQATLPDLIHRLTPGDAVVITENDKPVAKLVSEPPQAKSARRPRPPSTGIPKAGRWQGLVVPDDFDEPLAELDEYME